MAFFFSILMRRKIHIIYTWYQAFYILRILSIVYTFLFLFDRSVNNLSYCFFLALAEKRTACLEEVRKLKEIDSEEFLNKKNEKDEACHASLAITGLLIHPTS